MHDERPQPAPPARLTELASWRINRVALTAQRLVSDALAGAGVRRQHFAVLLVLDERGATSQAELGRRLRIDRSDMHAIVNDLARDGLIIRGRDEVDRRRNSVELTSAGVDVLAQLDEYVNRAQETLLEPLSPTERSELQRLLGRLQQHHDRLSDQPAL